MLHFFEVITAALETAKPEGGKLQQADLAQVLGCSQMAISNYLRGTSLPATPRLPAYAAALGLPLERLAVIVATDRVLHDKRRLAPLATAYHQRRRSPAAGAA